MTASSRSTWAAAAAILLLMLMVVLSRDFGFTWDERFQQKYGEQIWDYYHGRLPRASFDTTFGNQYLYGGLVEVVSVAAQHVMREDVYVVRHMVDAVFGWVGIVFAGLLAARAFGARAGWLAAVLMALSPRYLGDSMNNPKDTPFAALTMAALYYSLSVEWRPPHLSWRHAAKLCAAIALAVNIRPLGLVLLGFAGAAVMLVAAAAAAREVQTHGWSWSRALNGPLAALGRLAAVAVVAIPAGTIAWPWAQAQPFVRPIEAFLISTRLDWAGGFAVLYNGRDVAAGTLPWHYVPHWLLMTLPPVVPIGLVLSLFFFRFDVRGKFVWVSLAVFALVPVMGAIVRHATIYDGIRHLLFIIPPITVLAAAGWAAALSVRVPASALAAALLTVCLAEPALFQVRNHPNQIVYFSPAFGGPREAFARFDMDYWGNSVLQAVDWSAHLAERLGQPIVVSGNPSHVIEADAARYSALAFSEPQRGSNQLDIRLLRGPSGSVREFAERGDVLYSVRMADGTPLCIVLPGPAFDTIRAQVPAALAH